MRKYLLFAAFLLVAMVGGVSVASAQSIVPTFSSGYSSGAATSLTSPSYAVYPGTSYCPSLSYNLYRGVSDRYTNGQVSALQYFMGVYFAAEPVPVTGYFGPITANYVARFQAMQGIYPVTGGVGPLTRAAIARACGGAGVIPPNPTPVSVQVTSPQQGAVYNQGSTLYIAWNGSTPSYSVASIIDLYSVQTGKVGTMAIQNGPTGTYAWTIPPFPNNVICTMQYPNNLCGASIPDGQYYIRVSLVVGNGFDNSAPLTSANSGRFTVNRGTVTTSPTFTASPVYGYAPLTTAFTVGGEAGSYKIDYGDGTSERVTLPTIYCITTPCNAPPVTVQHTYYARGTYTARLLSDPSCFYTEPRCLMMVRNLGTATITVY